MANTPFSRSNLILLPFMALLMVLPFPGTVTTRLIFLFGVFVVALIVSLGQPHLYRSFPPGRWGIILWMTICGLSVLYSSDPGYSLKEIKNEIGYTLVAFFSFFIIGQQDGQARILLRALALGMSLIGIMAMYSWLSNHMTWQEDATHGGVGSFSTYIVTCLPALFWSSLKDNSVYWRRAAQFLIGFALLLAFITLQRAVWPALAAEFLLAFFLLRRTGRIRANKAVSMFLIATVLMAAIATLSLSNTMRGMPSLGSLVPSEKSLDTPVVRQNGSDGDARLPYWPAIVRTIADHPLIGAGFGQGMMKKAYPELIPPNLTALWHAHNVVLNYAIQMGFPGALALLLMFFGLARYYWRSLRENPQMAVAATAGIMLIAGVLLRNQTNDFFRRDMALLFWSLTGLFSALVLPRKVAA